MRYLKSALAVCALTTLTATGCIEKINTNNRKAFEINKLDACLAIVVDRSGSFSGTWQEHGYPLLQQLMLKFFSEGAGTEARVVIAQLSGDNNIVLFEATPSEFQARFPSPDALAQFLDENSSPHSSPVYQATGEVIDYVIAMPGVTSETRMLTVVLSDLVDSTLDASERVGAGQSMLKSLTRYREMGGSIALYFVAREEQDRWHAILAKAGFTDGNYVITSDVVANPPLPRFD